jgi:hypothetical protein
LSSSTCVVSFSGLSIWFRVCPVHMCCQFLWIVYLIPCLSCAPVLSVSLDCRCTGQTRNQIDNPETLTTQVHRTNTESNRQSRETDTTGGPRQTRNQIPCLSSFTCVVSFSGLSIWFRVCPVHLCCQFLWIVYLIPCLSSFTCVVSFSGLSIWFRVCLRNQIDNPEKLTTQVDEDKHGIK